MEIFQKVGKNKKIIFTGLAIFCLIFLFLNNFFWHSFFVGSLFSFFWFLVAGFHLGNFFGHFFTGGKWFKFLVGLFLALYLMTFGLAVPIVFFKITLTYFYTFLLLLTVIIYLINHFLNKKIKILNNDQNLKHFEFKNWNFFRNWKLKIENHIPYILFFILYIIGWLLLMRARTGEYLLSPWNAISKYYQIIWFALAFLLVYFIFFKIKTKKILFLLILTSLLFHAYLPFVSENSFGVDRWRHVGAERRLMQGGIEPPALIGDISYLKLGPISLPKVFFMPNKFSYSNQWGMTIGLSWLTQIDILKIDQYLILFLWSIFFIIFVYKLSWLIFKKDKLSFLITFVALFCFFSLQVGGAITVPHALGFLPFLFFLVVFFSYLKNSEKKLWPLIVFSFILLIFNYILYLILALQIFIFGLILRSGERVKKIILPVLIIIFIFSLPLLDRLSGTSFFAYKPLEAIKILPQKIAEFVIKVFPSYLYYRGGENLALPILIKNFPWVLIFTPLVFLFVILGLIKKWKNNLLVKILAIFLFIFVANQFISFSFMKNYRLLSTRLTNVLILFLAIFFTAGLYWLFEKNFGREKNQTLKINFINVLLFLSIALFLTALSITTYASGPAYGNVTNNELAVAKYLNQEIMANRSCGCQTKKEAIKEFCVFDAGWRLLALESINGMIAGNFPTDDIDFIQKEKDELYRQMLNQPSREILKKTLQITGAQKCFFVVNQSWVKPEIFEQIKEILGEPKIIENVYIWKYNYNFL